MYIISKHSNSGFTLIEVLITVTLALLVITISFSALLYSSRGSQETQMKTNRDFEIMKVYAQMRQQLVNLYVSPDQDMSLLGEKGLKEHEDILHFYTTSPVLERGVVEAEYRINSLEERPVLLYREFPFVRKLELMSSAKEVELKTVRWVKLSDLIQGMTLGYYKGEQEFREWNGKDPPERIVVELSYATGKEVESYSFSVTPGVLSMKKQQ